LKAAFSGWNSVGLLSFGWVRGSNRQQQQQKQQANNNTTAAAAAAAAPPHLVPHEHPPKSAASIPESASVLSSRIIRCDVVNFLTFFTHVFDVFTAFLVSVFECV